MNNQVYRLLDVIGEIVDDLPLTNKMNLTYGDIYQLDLRKQSIFPILHVNVSGAALSGSMLNTIQITIDVLAMDLIDKNDNDPRDINAQGSVTKSWYRSGYSNEIDVLNEMLFVQNRILASFKRGQPTNELIQLLDDSVTLQPFFEEFDNNLAGWQASYTLVMPNVDVKVCGTSY